MIASEKQKIQQIDYQKVQRKDRKKMHCPICRKDIYHFLPLRQKHTSRNTLQPLYVLETSKAGYICVNDVQSKTVARKLPVLGNLENLLIPNNPCPSCVE